MERPPVRRLEFAVRLVDERLRRELVGAHGGNARNTRAPPARRSARHPGGRPGRPPSPRHAGQERAQRRGQLVGRLLGGLAVALLGGVPRLVAGAWAALGMCLVLGQVGELLELPGWLLDLSPFRHAPRPPVDELTVLPLAVLLGCAALLTAAGFAGLRRRDIG